MNCLGEFLVAVVIALSIMTIINFGWAGVVFLILLFLAISLVGLLSFLMVKE
jgi:hypothetical protein